MPSPLSGTTAISLSLFIFQIQMSFPNTIHNALTLPFLSLSLISLSMKPSMNLSLFTTLSNPNSNVNSTKSPARIGILEGGVVGLGIVAAMTSSIESETHHHHHHQHHSPIPIVSSAKPAANFRGINFDDHDLNDFIGNTCLLPNGVFSASPLYIGDPATHSFSADFLNSCNLCNKLLHGLDIFIYRGERAFCSAECRETHIRNDDYQEKCRTGAMKPLDCSMPPCTDPPVSFAAGIVAA